MNPLALWRITVLIAVFCISNMCIVHCTEYELVCWCHGEPPCPLADNCFNCFCSIFLSMYIVHCAEYELVCWCHGEPPCPLADNCDHSPHPATWVRVGQRASNTRTKNCSFVFFVSVICALYRVRAGLLVPWGTPLPSGG